MSTEFSTVSSSSFDPAALASKLTEKSAEGWTVVSIVSTGGDVTAFLSRDGSGSSSASSGTSSSSSGSIGSSASSGSSGSSVGQSSGSYVAGSSSGGSMGGSSSYQPTPEPASPSYESASSYRADPTPEPASASSEPAGWGSAPESSSSSSSSSSSTPDPTPSYTPAASAPAAAPTPSVPAGWYADPAGRFELRYWDGGTWTEHVSRAGQQYTDPPVA